MAGKVHASIGKRRTSNANGAAKQGQSAQSSEIGGQASVMHPWTQQAGISARGNMAAQGRMTGAKAAVGGRAIVPVGASGNAVRVVDLSPSPVLAMFDSDSRAGSWDGLLSRWISCACACERCAMADLSVAETKIPAVC